MTLDGETDFVLIATVGSVHIFKSNSLLFIVFEISFRDKNRFSIGATEEKKLQKSCNSLFTPIRVKQLLKKKKKKSSAGLDFVH